jgi:hypothetical protein
MLFGRKSTGSPNLPAFLLSSRVAKWAGFAMATEGEIHPDPFDQHAQALVVFKAYRDEQEKQEQVVGRISAYASSTAANRPCCRSRTSFVNRPIARRRRILMVMLLWYPHSHEVDRLAAGALRCATTLDRASHAGSHHARNSGFATGS